MFDLNYGGGGGGGTTKGAAAGIEEESKSTAVAAKAKAKATVKSIKVRKGGWIAKGQVVILIKDTHDKLQKIKTEAPGKVEEIHVSIGEQIEKG